MRALGSLFFLFVASAAAQVSASLPTKNVGQSFWRPVQPGEASLFGALENLGQTLEQDRLLRSRGIHRSFNFHYKAFNYEKDFFHVYRGFTLKSFWDGRMNLGLFSHRPTRGILFGPGGNYHPSRPQRYELRFRWNLGER